MDESEYLGSLLAGINEAAVAIRYSRIICSNSAADKLLQVPPPIPVIIIEDETNGFFSVSINKKLYTAVKFTLSGQEFHLLSLSKEKSEPLQILQSTGVAMRNTLNLLHGATGIVFDKLENSNDPTLLQCLSIIRHNHFKLTNIIENIDRILDYENSVPLSPELINMNQLCKNLVSTIRALTSDKEIDIVFENPKKDVITFADRIKIEYMLLNLFSNSIKHTPKNGKITLSLKQSDGNMKLLLKDNGEGISEEVLSYVFEYYKQPLQLHDSSRGAGIGLTAALYIARLHGGTIMLNSNKRKGTSAIVSIPINLGDASAFKENSNILIRNDDLRLFLSALSAVIDHSRYRSPFN